MKKRLLASLLVLVLLLSGCSTNAASRKVPDTILWFNAVYAVITTKNEADVKLVSGYTKNDSNTEMIIKGLEEFWDVTDRESAEETLQWLIEDGGHNKDLLDEYDQNELSTYTRDELVDVLSDTSYTNIDRAYFLGIYDSVTAYGDNAIAAWDLSRAMQLCAWYYLADYYTYEEAMDTSLAIAENLQNIYSSWDDMMQSYYYGFQYWNEDDMNDVDSESYNRREIYESLKKQEKSPYALDWNYNLQKEW